MPTTVTSSVLIHREKKGLTQEELAALVGVSRQTIFAIEKGRYTPSVALALSLAKVFKVSVEDLFTVHTSRS